MAVPRLRKPTPRPPQLKVASAACEAAANGTATAERLQREHDAHVASVRVVHAAALADAEGRCAAIEGALDRAKRNLALCVARAPARRHVARAVCILAAIPRSSTPRCSGSWRMRNRCTAAPWRNWGRRRTATA